MHLILFSFCSTATFRALDKNYLTPFFTTQTGDDEEQEDFGKFRVDNIYLVKKWSHESATWNFEYLSTNVNS